jgi:hypothetical protein
MVLVALVAAFLAALVWRLTAPAHSLVGRLVIVVLVVAVGKGYWVERPLLFGLLALVAVLYSAEGRLDPRWLVPVMWLWVNVHGSFPLGIVALVALAVGRALDRESAARELAALRWGVVGVVIGAVNPLGPRLLTFPIELLTKQDVLRQIVEWQAPRFTTFSERMFLIESLLAIVLLVRRPRWRTALPLVVFLAAALLGARNVVVASIVLVPGLVDGLRGVGSLVGDERRAIYRPMAMVLCAATILVAIVQLDDPLARLRTQYPVAAVDRAEALGLVGSDKHLVTEDFVGNYLEARFGRAAQAFIDDRYDMFPEDLVDDSSALLRGSPGWQQVLTKYRIDAVLWETREPLAQLLQSSPTWRVVYVDKDWLLAVRG